MNKELEAKIEEEVKLKNLIFEALGEASLQWEPKPTGVFDSTGAIKVGEKLYSDVEKIINWLVPYVVELAREEITVKVEEDGFRQVREYTQEEILAKVWEELK